MLKKIALGALLTGLVAVLIWGAVNRTNAISAQGLAGGGRHGQSTEYAGAETPAQGNGGRWSQVAPEATGWNGGGRWGQAGAAGLGSGVQGEDTLRGVPQADTQPQEWMTLKGVVVSATADLIEIETESGAVIPFEGQPLRFALQQGFAARAGDAVSVSGFEENGEFKIGVVTNLTTGKSVTLRDVAGRPGWAGRGRRG